MNRSLSRRRLLQTLAGTTAGLAIAMPATPAVATSHPINVTATTGMIGDAARRIGGKHARVKSLMGPGVDPHAYRQTRTDILALSRADLVLWHGLYLEAQMEGFFRGFAHGNPSSNT